MTTGLIMNMNETKLMTSSQEIQIKVGQETVSCTEYYTYLGQANHSRTKLKNKNVKSFIVLDKSKELKIERSIGQVHYYAQPKHEQSPNIKNVTKRKAEENGKENIVNSASRLHNEHRYQEGNTNNVSHVTQEIKWRTGQEGSLDHNRWAYAVKLWDPSTGSKRPGNQKRDGWST